MRGVLSALLLIVLSATAVAQVKNPVKWAFSVKKVSGGVFQIHMNATIEQGWHIYSQSTPEGGPIPTAFTFSKNPLVTVSGKVKEIGKVEKHFEPLFKVDVIQFSDKVEFVQLVKVKKGVKTSVNGLVEYMSCNDKECLPPKEEKFSLSLQ